jgi:hypothetical protein
LPACGSFPLLNHINTINKHAKYVYGIIGLYLILPHWWLFEVRRHRIIRVEIVV